MSENVVNFTEVGPRTLQTSASYEEAFAYVRSVMESHGGKIKKDDIQSGLIEAAWRYGLNAFGLRVKAQFRTLSDDSIELNLNGGFADALDTTGAGEKKANEICALISGRGTDHTNLLPPRVGDDGNQHRGKSKNVSGILAILLGGLGAHKFYLGNWGLGILYFASLLIVPYLSMIIGVVEGIRYFTMAEYDFNKKYNYTDVKPFEVIW